MMQGVAMFRGLSSNAGALAMPVSKEDSAN